MTALGNLGMVGTLVRSFGLARGAGAQIFNLLDTVPTINPLLERGFVPNMAEGSIELKNVVFQYPSRSNVPVSILCRIKTETIELELFICDLTA